MWEQIELSRHVKVARTPPGNPELAALSKEGVRAIIDLRTDAEPRSGASSPPLEAEQARAHGIEHIRVPISAARVDKADLDRVGEALLNAPKPVLIHCASGKRAGMIALIHSAIETGTPGTETLEMARHLDLVFGDPAQQHLFAEYIDQRETRPDPQRRRREALRVDGKPIPLLPEAARKLSDEQREDEHRHLALDEGKPIRPAPVAAQLRRSRVRVGPIPGARPSRPLSRPPLRPARPIGSHRVGMTLGAIAAAAVLLLDRRLRLPLLIAGGAMAGRAVMVLRAHPPAPLPPPPTDPVLDREIADLEKRVRRLRKTA